MFKVDMTEFDATFKEYMKVSSRELARAINTKAYFIARRAMRETSRVEREQIYKEMDREITAIRRKGKTAGSSSTVKRKFALAARWLAKKRGTSGYNKQRRSLYSKAIKSAASKIIGTRLRATGFIKAGFLPAIKTLAPVSDYSGAPEMGQKPKLVGVPKGRAVIAQPGMTPTAQIVSSIGLTGKRAGKQLKALKKYGEPAMQRAINAESASMVKYMSDKILKAARSIGIKANA